MRTTLEKAIVAVEAFIAAWAMAAGILFLIRPDGSLLQARTSDLVRGPFLDYRIPGVILLVVIGGVTTAAALLTARRAPCRDIAVALSGATLIGFEAVQVCLVTFSPLQPAVACAGAWLVIVACRERSSRHRRTRQK